MTRGEHSVKSPADGAVIDRVDPPVAVATSGIIDVQDAWQAHLTDERNDWADPNRDEGFWAANVESYEDRLIEPPAGIGVIDALLEGGESALEIGPGTGRYTRRLSQRVDRVTAIEDATPVRSYLRSSLEAAGLADSVDIVPRSWEHVTIVEASDAESTAARLSPHDVVVAGWSLYRQPELGECLERIHAAANTGFVLIDSPGAVPPHRRLAIDADETVLPSPPPRAAYYSTLLADCGLFPEVHIERRPRVRRASTLERLVADLLGNAAIEPDTAADALDPWLNRHDGGWEYRYELPVAVLVWRASDA